MMKKKLGSILLIDDNQADNIYHRIVIDEAGAADKVEIASGAEEALQYLKANAPELIFLDINMPKMNGWDFLQEYRKLQPAQTNKPVIIVLTTSESPADLQKAQEFREVSDFRVKPLSVEMLEGIIEEYFHD
jgi:CheY-like chemotaxis protein